uniref:Uncharacterized protein n=1 Tax=Lepeophtheirus salmonis TaxID=72036 RepID=A0A0K2UTV5_LEPSM
MLPLTCSTRAIRIKTDILPGQDLQYLIFYKINTIYNVTHLS